MTKVDYPLFKVHVPIEKAMKEIEKVFQSGFINEGVQVTELTKVMQTKLETDNLCLVNSCTSALTLALKLSGVKPGSAVVSTPMTCLATNTPIVNLGADIEWADIDPWTGTIEPLSVIEAIQKVKSRAKKTSAIMAVDWAGNLCDYESLDKIASSYNVHLIRDAAHALLARYDGVQAHVKPDFTTYSLQAIKHTTTGDGGILVCKKESNLNRAKALKWFGIDRDQAKDTNGNWKGQHWDFDVEEAGFKFNMNNVSAAIGLAQTGYIEMAIGKHKRNAKIYAERFRDLETVKPLRLEHNSESSHWVYTVRLVEANEDRRNYILQKLNEKGVHAGVVHVPNHEYKCFEQYWKELPGVEEFAAAQFALPCGWWMEEDDINKSFDILKSVLKEE